MPSKDTTAGVGGAVVVAVMLFGLTPGRVAGQQSVGDCNNDGKIAITELISCVAIALGRANAPICPQCDADSNGRVTINELIEAVRNAQCGCTVPRPTPPPTSIRTKTGTATPTPTDTPATGTPPLTPSRTPTNTRTPTPPLTHTRTRTWTPTPTTTNTVTPCPSATPCPSGSSRLCFDPPRNCSCRCQPDTSGTYFSDDFEGGLGNWIVSESDWVLVNTESGHRICASPEGKYVVHTNATLTLKQPIDLSGATFPVLTFCGEKGGRWCERCGAWTLEERIARLAPTFPVSATAYGCSWP